MNDIRRTILWVIFGFSLVMLWDQWQVYNGQQATFFPSTKPAATAGRAGPGQRAGRACRARPAVPTTSATAAATAARRRRPRRPAGTTAAPAARARHRHHRRAARDLRQRRRLAGAHRVSQARAGEKPDVPYVLLDQSANRVYVAQTGLIGGDFPNAQDADDGQARRAHAQGRRQRAHGALRVAGAGRREAGQDLHASSAAPTTSA